MFLAASLFAVSFLIRLPWLWEVPRYIDELREVDLAYQIYQGSARPSTMQPGTSELSTITS